MKVFLDTNVLASAIATRGLCADVLREVLSSEELVISQSVLDELKRVLADKFGLPPKIISEALAMLCTDSELSNATKKIAIEIQDKDDIVILSDAISAAVDIFVTGDKEVSALSRIDQMEILSPRAFWEKLRRE
ncbi:MAG: putative toxin-antitoxin system toxin component, PIN family [Chitinivibrionales bacterium]|nr:putative toxin-antitoxin system toxin component, PIN family [Chitinivibrionales bacterium]